MLYTKHCEDMLKERAIPKPWVERTINDPRRVEDKPDGTRHYLCQIPEHGNGWLRVIVNVTDEPNRIITIFFNRRLKAEK